MGSGWNAVSRVAGGWMAGIVPLLAGTAALAAAAPVVVQQSSPRNLSRVIEQRSSVVSIDRSQTVTQGSTTITEIVRIGPDPTPAVVSQSGQANRAVTFQEGTAPRLSLRQTGTSNDSRTVQRTIP